MRALLIVALLASTARADDYDPEEELRVAMKNRTECLSHVVALERRGVEVKERAECEARAAARLVDDMRSAIAKAIEFPWVWAEECVQRWPIALASGVKPTARVLIGARSRRGFVRVQGTLEQLYVKHCENAYTPRRRGE